MATDSLQPGDKCRIVDVEGQVTFVIGRDIEKYTDNGFEDARSAKCTWPSLKAHGQAFLLQTRTCPRHKCTLCPDRHTPLCHAPRTLTSSLFVYIQRMPSMWMRWGFLCTIWRYNSIAPRAVGRRGTRGGRGASGQRKGWSGSPGSNRCGNCKASMTPGSAAPQGIAPPFGWVSSAGRPTESTHARRPTPPPHGPC